MQRQSDMTSSFSQYQIVFQLKRQQTFERIHLRIFCESQIVCLSRPSVPRACTFLVRIDRSSALSFNWSPPNPTASRVSSKRLVRILQLSVGPSLVCCSARSRSDRSSLPCRRSSRQCLLSSALSQFLRRTRPSNQTAHVLVPHQERRILLFQLLVLHGECPHLLHVSFTSTLLDKKVLGVFWSHPNRGSRPLPSLVSQPFELKRLIATTPHLTW